MFLDQATIYVYAGQGGDGIVAFRREALVPHGGPSGGDGGKGGDVILRVNSQLGTLLDYRYRQHYRAPRGEHGEGSNRTGRSGEDLVLMVPPGTVVNDADTGETLGELLHEGEELVVARGGRGGRGNARFATATNQAPRRADSGEEGEERRITLELKLIADVGLVGEPNAGKSTFLAAVSHATPKIGDYPFTTLTPNLGVVRLSDGRAFVVADIPGIIEGAHEGKGLGLQFLRHIERTRTLAYLIPADALDAQAEFERLRAELDSYSPELAAKPHCIVFTKADLLPPEWETPRIEAPDAWGQFLVSAVARRGLDSL
nr:GTPase ObgE [Gemmatimonadota bacterium]